MRVVYLDDLGIGEGFVEEVHVGAELERVNEEVLLASGDLHQAAESLEGPVAVLLQRRQKSACLDRAPPHSMRNESLTI